MTILQMKYFIVVAQSGSFHKAAEKLFVSQQGISKQIAAIEKELDLQLIDRSNRKNISLTKEGQLLYKSWYEILKKYHSDLEDALISSGKRRKKLRIGIFEAGPIADYVMPLINSYRAKEPDTDVECIFTDEESVMNGLEQTDLDLVFALCSKYRNYDINCYPIYYDKVCIAISKNHPLAKKENLSVKDIMDVPVFVLKSRYSFDAHNNIIRMLKASGYDMSQIVPVDDINNLEMLLYMAGGVTIAPRILLRNSSGDIRYYPLSGTPDGDSIILHIIWKSEKMKSEAMKIIGVE